MTVGRLLRPTEATIVQIVAVAKVRPWHLSHDAIQQVLGYAFLSDRG